MVIKIQINISNKFFYTIITLSILIILCVGVWAAERASSGGGTHNFEEVGLPSCSNGQVLKWDSGDWECGEDIDTLTPNTNTNAETICPNDQFLDGDGDCRTLSFTNTNAETICPDNKFLDGDGQCHSRKALYQVTNGYCQNKGAITVDNKCARKTCGTGFLPPYYNCAGKCIAFSKQLVLGGCSNTRLGYLIT
jgi:hypothetical protein